MRNSASHTPTTAEGVPKASEHLADTKRFPLPRFVRALIMSLALTTATVPAATVLTPSNAMGQVDKSAVERKKAEIEEEIFMGFETLSPPAKMFRKGKWAQLLRYKLEAERSLNRDPEYKRGAAKEEYRKIYEEVFGKEYKSAFALFGSPYFLYEIIRKAMSMNVQTIKIDDNADYITGEAFIHMVAVHQVTQESADDAERQAHEREERRAQEERWEREQEAQRAIERCKEASEHQYRACMSGRREQTAATAIACVEQKKARDLMCQ